MPVIGGRERWRGRIDDLAVEVEWEEGAGRFLLSVALPEGAPAGLSLRRDSVGARLRGGVDLPVDDAGIDHLLRVDAADPHQAAVRLSWPDLSAALGALFAREHDVRVEDGRILAWDDSGDPAALHRLRRLMLAVARLLGDGRTAWADLATMHGVVFDQAPDRRTLAGTVRGMRLSVESTRVDEAWTTVAHVGVPGLPPGLRIVPGRGELGDPILDRFVRTEGPAATLAALAAPATLDALRGPLLEALDRWPDLRVADGAVRIATPGADQAELGPLLEAAVAVADALAPLARA
jgi:hypothetical protein